MLSLWSLAAGPLRADRAPPSPIWWHVPGRRMGGPPACPGSGRRHHQIHGPGRQGCAPRPARPVVGTGP
eukprot:2764243-Alexandrium_andersonii.AAC.1